MRVLALSSQKGGSGKTTLSGHLAVQAQLAGAGPVVLIDIDPQGSLADWWNEREAEMPAFAQTTVARLAADLEILKQQGFKLAVIDTPPAITMAIQSVIQVAELIILPTRPSPHDLRAVGATVDLCERAGKPLIFVVNAATPKARITHEAAVALSQHGTVAPVTLHHRAGLCAAPSRHAASGRRFRPPGRRPVTGARTMAEAKPFASLSSGLLARKGAAKPAMRPQGFGSFGGSLEDLGWNDMGQPAPEHVPSSVEALTPAPRLHATAEPAFEPV